MSLTTVQQVNLLALGAANGQPEGLDAPMFSTEEVTFFLEQEGNDIRLAAALMLETIANSASRVGRIKSTGNFQDSSVSIPDNLRAGARKLREQVEGLPASAEVFPNTWETVY